MRRSHQILAALPLALFLLLFFVLPIGFELVQSGSAPAGLLSQYARVFADRYYLLVIGQTVLFGLVVTLFCILLGYPFGFAIARAQGSTRSILIFLALAPLLINVVVRSFGWMVILGGGGVVDRLAQSLGFGSFVLLYTWPGLVIAMVHVLLPFVVLTVAATVETIDPALTEAASTLGASPAARFIHIVLPLSREGLIAGAVLSFTLAIGSFVTVMLLGNTATMVLPLLVYQQLTVAADWPFAAALGISLLAIIVVLLGLQQALLRRKVLAQVAG